MSLTVLPAIAQEKSPHKLTVGEAINVMNAINALDAHTTGVVDHTGAAVTAPNNFTFSGTTRLAMARDAAQGAIAFKAYQDALNAVRAQMAAKEPKEKLNADGVPPDKEDALKKEAAKIWDAPTDVALVHIKVADLCLDAAPPACPSKNDIPNAILMALLPIVDQ